MGNRRFQKIESLHALGTREPERLKVTALNLFHPTAPSPRFKMSVLGYYDTATQGEG